jgi:FlaA1/EpsC-like NDP-sugar epimerase
VIPTRLAKWFDCISPVLRFAGGSRRRGALQNQAWAARPNVYDRDGSSAAKANGFRAHSESVGNHGASAQSAGPHQEKEMLGNLKFSQHDGFDRIGRRLLSYSLDIAAFSSSAFVAFELRFDGALPAQFFRPMLVAMSIWMGFQLVAFIGCRVSWDHWRHTSASDGARVLIASSIGSIAGGLAIFLLLGTWAVPRSIYVLDWIVTCLLTLGGRMAVRVAVNARLLNRAEDGLTKTLIYGAGGAGAALMLELRQNETLKCEVVGLIDDAPHKAGLNLHGRRVLGGGRDLGALVKKHAVKQVLIAIPSATGEQMVRILKHAIEAKVKYKMVPSLGELIHDAELGNHVRDVAVEDLLGRKPVRLDQSVIQERIEGKVVMVTGAAGSIGSEICRQIARFNPLALVGFDEAETPLFLLDRELRKARPQLAFHPVIGNITRPDDLRWVMQKFQPTILYHAAAYKHVPMMEQHVFAAVENNIFGTWQVALAAVRNGVDDFVMISTDKAVRPASIMGATKRVAELVIRALQQETGTRFVAVRFGNVLGSNGSVVPIFKEQIAAGGPVTVTHPEMTRYFMTIQEASQLVLQAFSMGKGGEVFVLDMGEPVKIVDLARNLILLSGLQPDRDIEIQFSGVRPGEKLFEQLKLKDECLIPTSHPKIRSFVSPLDFDARQIAAHLQDLKRIVELQDASALAVLLKEMIPDYNPTSRRLTDALTVAFCDAGKTISPGAPVYTERPVAAKFGPSTLIN